LRTIIAIVWLGFAALASCAPNPVTERSPQKETGADLAGRLCAGCHATGVDDKSRHKSAAPFRTLGDEYPIEYLAEALAEGIIVGHPDMPIFEMTPEQIDLFLAYLENVQEPVL